MFIRNYRDTSDPEVRENYGRLGSLVGIAANIILSASKIAVGTMFNSISITADGVNNLSDTGSSVVTLIGFKLASKPADKDHPFGHARYEYIAGLIVSFTILLLGTELIKSSYGKIIDPQEIEYGAAMAGVLIFSIAMKIWLSMFNNKIGEKISSATLKATSVDARNDVIATSAVLLAVFVSKLTGFQIDGYMGMVVALFIIYSGIGILKDTLSPILGEPPGEELVDEIERRIMSYEGVLNLHDLVLHNYGPGKYFGTVHVEVDANQNILKSHDMIDNIERDFSDDMNISMVVHLDPIITDDKEINDLKKMTNSIIKLIDERLTMHDFRVVRGETHTNLIFDVLVPFDFDMRNDELVDEISDFIKNEDRTYYAVITIDRSYVSTCTNRPQME
jgi:cation diffusion facilitator family transporter